MRAHELLSEANLSIRTFGERNPEYWTNLIGLLQDRKPLVIKIGKQNVEEINVAGPEKIAKQMEMIWNGDDVATPEQVAQIANFLIPLNDGRKIGFQNIFKSSEIKGVSADYNVGDIGEISLGISATARFRKNGSKITLEDYIALGKEMQIGPIPKLSSYQGQWVGTIPNADNDNLKLQIKLAARSMLAFEKFIVDLSSAPNNVRGVIQSSIKWANENAIIDATFEKINNSGTQNTIIISADGVGDQKGTKADLFLHVDDKAINLISAKAGVSQLGQAAGLDYDNTANFFKTVFGVNTNKYKSKWSADHKANLEVLRAIYSNDVIPKISSLTAGDNSRKEAELIKQVGNGLIHYANDIGQSGPEIIDIVKLMTTPTRPGYKLMRIDQDLVAALDDVDLFGKVMESGLGIAVYGNVNGTQMLLFRVRSYHSPAANTTRTIIEGGPLLDILATVKDKDDMQ